MRLTLLTLSLVGTSALSAGAATIGGSTGYALDRNGTDLTTFGDLGMTDTRATVTLSQRIDAISYRPVTGELYGYQAGRGGNPDAVYVIDPATGAATDTGAAPFEGAGISNGADVGFDFNNQIDAARAVSTANENVVFFPSSFPNADNANTIRQFTNLFYGAGDVNEGIDPEVFANAYTNALDGMTASTTLQYVLDARTNSLATLANNAGTLSTVAPVTLDGDLFDFDDDGGFDILSQFEGDNLALALLSSDDKAGFYQIDLATGAASFFGEPGDGRFISFAAQTGSETAAVPLPAGLPLILLGLGAMGGLRLRRRA